MEVQRVIFLIVIVVYCAYYVDSKVVVVGTPVVFTNNNGGGSDELQVPNGGIATKDYYMDANVNMAWYQPYDNINDLSAIATIDCVPNGRSVQLVVKGYSNARSARVRIKIFAELQ